MTGTRRAPVRWRAAAGLLGALSAAVDLLPAGWRYGYVHRVMRRVVGVPAFDRVEARSGPADEAVRGDQEARGELHAVLVTGNLDVGGVEAVIDHLVRRLPDQGVRTSVVCRSMGRTAQRLAEAGYVVRTAASEEETARELTALRPDVIQLHSAPSMFVDAALASKVPLVQVLHNTEVHHERADWTRARRLTGQCHTTIAVSELVREYHVRHVDPRTPRRMVVVPNAARSSLSCDERSREAARERLSGVLGVDLDSVPLVLCLSRYDSQKNLPATVTAFLDSVERTGRPAHLVVAGDPSDPIEAWRVELARRAHRCGEAATLLANSDATVLLAAADALVLTSFFEGWPVAATEALSVGLPVLMTDVGGARELVGGRPAAGHVVSNPAGRADAVTQKTIRRARRRLRQSNHAELLTGLEQLLSRLPEPPAERARRAEESRHRLSAEAMIRSHAAALRAAAATDVER